MIPPHDPHDAPGLETLPRWHDPRGVNVGVAAWAQPVVIPTFPVPAPDPNPMFLEQRVYQGSSGRVYPLPLVDRVSPAAVDEAHAALHLENAYLYVMVLPDLGGRIHLGVDKTAGYDFFYRQNLIKPALVGLAGPWMSGGVEFNWPQHHRPSTFMPCEWAIRIHPDGAQTVWLSEHEPMTRMKGMHGVTLYPDRSLIELRVRLYNRTPVTQTFLWWANVAARVHEAYQSFFPPDVRAVADHAKRATSTFPACDDQYYGVRYGERARHGVPADELPSLFPLPEGVDPNRLDWYGNIPVPTSYMVVQTDFEFFGGYDHVAEAGFVHVADRHISPGKKQWTWGNHAFGYAWDRNLTDTGGPYVELMAGVYTDNQPDFSFLAPYETKAFSQFWYPIREIGPAVCATRDVALSLREGRVGLCPSGRFPQAQVSVVVERAGEVRTEVVTVDLSPEAATWVDVEGTPVAVAVDDATGSILLRFDQRTLREHPTPVPATAPPAPEEVASQRDLYRIGRHLEQYRHATRAPEPYWEEALRRDPLDTDCLVGLARRAIDRAELDRAETLLVRAVDALTRWNPNPDTGEAHYLLGVVREARGDDAGAERAWGKAAWNYDVRAAAHLGLARVAARAGRHAEALAYVDQAEQGLGDANLIGFARAALRRHRGETEAARVAAQRVLDGDPLDHGCLRELAILSPEAERESAWERWHHATRRDPQNLIDLGLDYRAWGLEADAVDVLTPVQHHPVVRVLLGGRASDAGPLEGLFPNRLAEILALQEAVERDPTDAAARTLLGYVLYDRRRYEEAMAQWEASVQLDPDQAVVWRCLGLGEANVRGNLERAEACFDRAVEVRPDDARLVYERDQLAKRRGVDPQTRRDWLASRASLVAQRDDLTLEMASLEAQLGEPERGLALIQDRQFAPWEGGEGVALGVHARLHQLRARRAGDPHERVTELRQALDAPENLAEARHLLANASELWVALGDALTEAGEADEARRWYTRAADFQGDFQAMAVQTFSEQTLPRAVALQRLGRDEEAEALLAALAVYAEDLEQRPATIDYFATSLPALLLFPPDAQAVQVTTARFLQAQSAWGRGDRHRARELLIDVLQRDPNHARAADLLSEIGPE